MPTRLADPRRARRRSPTAWASCLRNFLSRARASASSLPATAFSFTAFVLLSRNIPVLSSKSADLFPDLMLQTHTLAGVFSHFTDLVANASGWAYAILFLFALLDVVIPAVPSETAVITAGVVASQGDLNVGLAILFAAAGAFVGDNLVYWIG